MSDNEGLKLEVTDPKEEQGDIEQKDDEGKDWVRGAGRLRTGVGGFERLQVVGVDKRTV